MKTFRTESNTLVIDELRSEQAEAIFNFIHRSVFTYINKIKYYTPQGYTHQIVAQGNCENLFTLERLALALYNPVQIAEDIGYVPEPVAEPVPATAKTVAPEKVIIQKENGKYNISERGCTGRYIYDSYTEAVVTALANNFEILEINKEKLAEIDFCNYDYNKVALIQEGNKIMVSTFAECRRVYEKYMNIFAI